MNVKYIYDYLNELTRCEWKDNAVENGIKYNDIDITQGTVYYQDVLSVMHTSVEQMLLELSADGQQQILQALYGRVIEIYEQSYDVITTDAVEALKRDVAGNLSPAVKADIELGYYVVQMHGIQRYFQRTLLVFLGNLLGVSMLPNVVRDNVEVEEVLPSRTSEKEWITYDELILMFDFRGVKSAKDATWRKKNGFDKCVTQTGGKGSAVKYSVSKIREWLENGKQSKKR